MPLLTVLFLGKPSSVLSSFLSNTLSGCLSKPSHRGPGDSYTNLMCFSCSRLGFSDLILQL